ncbi:hypothetical protein B0D71_17005 [Pseudomonas laurylsulfativorans]|uniref:Uncharacterized protein n=1 Tax=Pseudomonas laurylsulfativorans TaxID=1943631 RepID=A0A2S3VMP2_9PSED|nr:hypothetical protein B0D71_17005 [Pseudomonas laurylsulfativorans]
MVLYYLMDEIDTVGASLLAMNVNDNAGNLTVRGALTFIASKLAPTSSEARNAKTNAPHRRGAVYRATQFQPALSIRRIASA